MSTTDKAQIIVQLSQRIDTIEDAQKRISDKLDNFIENTTKKLDEYGAQLSEMKSNVLSLNKLIEDKFGDDFVIFDEHINTLLLLQEQRLKDREQSLWALFGKKLEVQKDVFTQQQNEYKEILKKLTSKAIETLNTEVEQARAALKNASKLDTMLTKAQKIASDNNKVLASVEAISRQEQERDKMLNDNQNELEKQNGEVKQKMEQLNAKFKEMEKTNLDITSQFKTITGKVDSTERTSKEEILKNKKSIIEWLEQDRAQLKEEILSLIETKGNIKVRAPSQSIDNAVKLWLEKHGLQEFIATFAENGFDTFLTIKYLDESDLQEMKVPQSKWDEIIASAKALE